MIHTTASTIFYNPIYISSIYRSPLIPAFINLNTYTGNSWNIISPAIGSDNYGGLTFYNATNSVTCMVIDRFNNVGIGKTNPDYTFDIDATVAKRIYDPITISSATTDNFPPVETIFTTVLDTPAPGYYWYILEIAYYALAGNITINTVELGFRNLTAQVIKR
jgi:hypothetical protein